MFKKVLKSTLILAAVGVTLAVLSPIVLAPLAVHLGLASGVAAALSATHPIWGGVFFGAFGAINAVITPAVDFLFGDAQTASQSTSRITVKGAPALSVSHAPIVAHAPISADLAEPQMEASTRFQDKFQPRNAETNFQDRVASQQSTLFQEKLENASDMQQQRSL